MGAIAGVSAIIGTILAILTFYFSTYLPYIQGQNNTATEAFTPLLRAIPGAEDQREKNIPGPTPPSGQEPAPGPTVENVGTTPPDIFVPDDITEDATGPDGAEVSFEVSAEDDLDGPVPVNCNPPSGSTFPIGTTEVTCTAADAAGNTEEESFTVTVQDTIVPAPQQPEPQQPEPQQPEPDGNVTESG